MGQFMDLLRGEHLLEVHPHGDTLEERVVELERELEHMKRVLRRLLVSLEEKFVVGFDDEEHLGSRVL